MARNGQNDGISSGKLMVPVCAREFDLDFVGHFSNKRAAIPTSLQFNKSLLATVAGVCKRLPITTAMATMKRTVCVAHANRGLFFACSLVDCVFFSGFFYGRRFIALSCLNQSDGLQAKGEPSPTRDTCLAATRNFVWAKKAIAKQR